MADRLFVTVLAAGASRRLGRPKQLVKLNGESLLRRQCRVALEANIGPVAAILGCHANDCAAEIADLDVSTQLNAEWKEGIASSIRVATAAAMDHGADGILIFHCDQYQITSRDLQTLHAAWIAAGISCAARSIHESYTGPPVILPSCVFPNLLALRGDEGARRVFSQLGSRAGIDPESVGWAYSPTIASDRASKAVGECAHPTRSGRDRERPLNRGGVIEVSMANACADLDVPAQLSDFPFLIDTLRQGR